MAKTFRCLALMFLFCVLAGIVYLRIPRETSDVVAPSTTTRATETRFAGQRHSGIDVTSSDALSHSNR
jgi:hypothetical protein